MGEESYSRKTKSLLIMSQHWYRWLLNYSAQDNTTLHHIQASNHNYRIGSFLCHATSHPQYFILQDSPAVRRNFRFLE